MAGRNKMTKPRVLVLHANGTNRDAEVAHAFTLAGAAPEIVHLHQLRAKEKSWHDYQILVIPGGFSYGDTLGAGKLLALDLQVYFAEEVKTFIENKKPVLGICNGFQVLVKSGLLPKPFSNTAEATLTFNAQGHFECRWVTLVAQSKKCIWTQQLNEPIDCPVAHGEGQFVLNNATLLSELRTNDQIALCYAYPDGKLADQNYPFNPNGSIAGIAGICNEQGTVLGLMPHPEDHVMDYQFPRWTRGEKGRSGLTLFKNGVDYVK